MAPISSHVAPALRAASTWAASSGVMCVAKKSKKNKKDKKNKKSKKK
jgi:hypothetical protein